jgi:hypothetical protein
VRIGDLPPVACQQRSLIQPFGLSAASAAYHFLLRRHCWRPGAVTSTLVAGQQRSLIQPFELSAASAAYHRAANSTLVRGSSVAARSRVREGRPSGRAPADGDLESAPSVRPTACIGRTRDDVAEDTATMEQVAGWPRQPEGLI